MKIISVVAARPNFMKIAPFINAIEKKNIELERNGKPLIEHILVHTGQHYDVEMSASFFRSLDIPFPDVNLEIGSGSHAEQVGKTMIAFEKVVKEQQPDWIVVVGDVNATCACSITAKKEHVKLAHIESGLRSFDLDMPEEINRMVTDRLSDLLFTTDEIADCNLRKEGVSADKIKRVGNIMIDTLVTHKPATDKMTIDDVIKRNLLDEKDVFLKNGAYAVVTMHRPSNVDSAAILSKLVEYIVGTLSLEMPVIWPVHPRTRKQLENYEVWDSLAGCPNIILLKPLVYHDLLKLNVHASLVLTDSGGLQEECCVLGVPCLTMRWNTERPVTLLEHGGVSMLVGNDVDKIHSGYLYIKDKVFNKHYPPLWDGQCADRIVNVFAEML